MMLASGTFWVSVCLTIDYGLLDPARIKARANKNQRKAAINGTNGTNGPGNGPDRQAGSGLPSGCTRARAVCTPERGGALVAWWAGRPSGALVTGRPSG